MLNITKEEALIKIEELKKYVNEKDTIKVGVVINSIFGNLKFQSTKTTIKEAVVEAVNSGANLRDANLRGADLRGADLRDADLSGANLRGADLSDADLRDADLSYANLSYADLRGANLSYADLRGANLSGANLRDAEMQNVKFIGKISYPKELTKKQLPDFLNALGYKCNEL